MQKSVPSSGRLLLLLLPLFAWGAACGQASLASKKVALENVKTGTRHFGIQKGHPHGEVEGYAGQLSVAAGDPVDLHVNVGQLQGRTSARVTWDAFRLGHYSGLLSHQVAHGGPADVTPQPKCGSSDGGKVACNWSRAFTVSTAGWVRGVYLVRLNRDDGFDAYVPLVVRDQARPEVLVVLPTATWQAYNGWGGSSLYEDDDGDLPLGKAVRVSFDRPFAGDDGAGELMRRDRFLIHWIEATQADVAYATDDDLDRDPTLLEGVKAVIIDGHDEYWSRAQRYAVEKAVAAGTSLLVLGANVGYWQIRYEDSPDGRSHREIVCYKDWAAKLDPVGPKSPELTNRFRDTGRPEGQLLGVQYMDGWSYSGFPMAVTDPDHWVFAGSGAKKGDTLWRAAGYEIDQVVPGVSPKVDVLAEAPTLSAFGTLHPAQMVVREQGKAVVFAAGGIDFVQALQSGQQGNPIAGHLLANLLHRALGHPLAHLPALKASASAPQGTAASKVVLFAGSRGAQGDADGPPGQGQLRAPVAMVAMPDGSLVVSDAVSGLLRRVSPTGVLSTLPVKLQRVLGLAAASDGTLYAADADARAVFQIRAGEVVRLAGQLRPDGSGESGRRDGPGVQALFMMPTGLALAPDGKSLVVADFYGPLRRIDLVDPAHTVTTLVRDLGSPTSVVNGPQGSLFVLDQEHQGLWNVPATGKPTHVFMSSGRSDGDLVHVRTLASYGLAALPDGSLVFADAGNRSLRHLVGDQVKTLVGGGRAGDRDGRGDETDLLVPSAVAVSADGRLFVAEAGLGLIKQITP